MNILTCLCSLMLLATSLQIYYVDEDKTINFDEIDIGEEMVKGEVIPDVLPKPPKKLLRVKFPKQPDLIPGQRLYYSQYFMEPEFFYDWENKTYYTMYMSQLTRYAETHEYFTIDPYYNLTYGRDEFCYWVRINMWENYTLSGRTLLEYHAPLDQDDRRTCDRYVMFLFKQKYKITELPEPEERSIYLIGELPKTAEFAKQYDLGEPLAGNYFITHW